MGDTTCAGPQEPRWEISDGPFPFARDRCRNAARRFEPHNKRAIRPYQALGFKKEGLLKQAAFIDGERIDLVLMAALRPPQLRHRRSANVLRGNAVPTVESASAAGHLVA
jgi:hypothetical protein